MSERERDRERKRFPFVLFAFVACGRKHINFALGETDNVVVMGEWLLRLPFLSPPCVNLIDSLFPSPQARE